MGDIVSGVIQKQVSSNTPGMEKQLLQQSQNGGSFENVLQNGTQQTAQTQNPQSLPAENNITNDKRLDAMRLDLTERINNLPDGVSKTTAILPEFLDVKTRASWFKDYLNKEMSSGLNTNQSKDLMGRFTNVEQEINNVNSIMSSNKELSQGELLGLQARLYQVSQHIEVLSKVVDQMTGGVKTILNTKV